jgi:MoxR-like ATPase
LMMRSSWAIGLAMSMSLGLVDSCSPVRMSPVVNTDLVRLRSLMPFGLRILGGGFRKRLPITRLLACAGGRLSGESQEALFDDHRTFEGSAEGPISHTTAAGGRSPFSGPIPPSECRTRNIGAMQPARSYGSIDDLQESLRAQAYLADRALATAVYLALSLDKPLLLEGEAGVGKTEVAKALSAGLGRTLIRLQCYEGIDANQALYEWNYSKQLIALRAAQVGEAKRVEDLFSENFLVERPLLAALRAGDRAVLLVDELDRADDEFEAFLLEVLSEFAVTVPELGRIHAEFPPAVVITSNRTRELHDALKRRCLYHWIDHPTLEREVEIISVRAPHVGSMLARQVAAAVARLRDLDVAKRPGVAEAIDWAHALAFLGVETLDEDAAASTLGSVLKDHEDLELAREAIADVVGGAR